MTNIKDLLKQIDEVATAGSTYDALVFNLSRAEPLLVAFWNEAIEKCAATSYEECEDDICPEKIRELKLPTEEMI